MDTPIVAPAFDCGICDVIHPHHCPKMVGWCQVCQPPISTAASNVLAHEVGQFAPQSDYAKREGLAPVVVRQRLARSA